MNRGPALARSLLRTGITCCRGKSTLSPWRCRRESLRCRVYTEVWTGQKYQNSNRRLSRSSFLRGLLFKLPAWALCQVPQLQLLHDRGLVLPFARLPACFFPLPPPQPMLSSCLPALGSVTLVNQGLLVYVVDVLPGLASLGCALVRLKVEGLGHSASSWDPPPPLPLPEPFCAQFRFLYGLCAEALVRFNIASGLSCMECKRLHVASACACSGQSLVGRSYE